MAWPLPADAQTYQSAADAPAGGGDMMDFPQVLPQETIGPAGGAIPQFARVAVDYLGDERIDETQSCGRAAGARRVRQALAEIDPFPVLEAARPVVNGLPADVEEV